MSKAIGVHVFAGGFTRGVQEVFNVEQQLEIHDFGADTARQLGVEVIRADDYRDWPSPNGVSFAFGNPRCTAFSCVTGSCGAGAHGPFAKQTKDAIEFANWVTENQVPVAVWESVTQAYSVGKELLDWMRDVLYIPAGYRIAHCFIDASAHGNAQKRLRYFHVAYKRPLVFNLDPPKLPPFRKAVWDVIHEHEDEEWKEERLYAGFTDYSPNSTASLTPDEWACVPFLETGWCINMLGHYRAHQLPDKLAWKYRHRISDMPFSMHCPRRLSYWTGCPTMHSGCARFIHPTKDRPLMIKELAKLMGWDFLPVGPQPHAQMAKGIVPAVGTWLAQQVQYSLDDAWGGEDYESNFNSRTCSFEGRTVDPNEHEKVFNLKNFAPGCFEWPREEAEKYGVRYSHGKSKFLCVD